MHRLRAAGAEVASVTAVGPRFCWEQTLALSPLPLLSAVAPLDLFRADRGLARVGLLGTTRAMQSGLFGQMRRTGTTVPAEVEAIGKACQDMALAGHCNAPTRQRFFDAGHEMMARGAQALALAGTDLALAFAGQGPGFPVIDALEVQADLLADLATGRKSLADVFGPQPKEAAR